MEHKTTFKVENIHGKWYECECCGSYSSEGIGIYVNDEMVWEKYSDGHMYGRQTEESILESVLNAWNDSRVKMIEENHTEEKRNQWNKDHPGNGIARTPESWEKYKNEMLDYQEGVFDNVKEDCSNLPYDETLQVKMIALWIENVCGEKITIEEYDVVDPVDQEIDRTRKQGFQEAF